MFRYDLDHQCHKMGLGPLHAVDLATALEKAQACRATLLDGLDPLAEKRRTRPEAKLQQARFVTFDECVAAYVAAHRSGWKSAKFAQH